MSVAGKVALVTGAGAGIGKSVAETLAVNGARIVAADLDKKTALETVGEIRRRNGSAQHVEVDVSNGSEVQLGIKKAVKYYGRLDILVNNAGVAIPSGFIADVPEESWDRTLAVNLKGVFLCSKYAIPYMMKNHAGSIVNIASAIGLFGLPNAAPYCASKGGVIALTKAMAMDCAPLGIRVNCICPGAVATSLQKRFYQRQKDPVRTKFIHENGYPLRRIASPADIANMVRYLASDDASYVTGSVFVIDGGMHAQYGEGILDRMLSGELKT